MTAAAMNRCHGWAFALLLLLESSCQMVAGEGIRQAIRIVKGVPGQAFMTPAPTPPMATPAAFREPHEAWGPAALTSLQGQCFPFTMDRYEYKVCPFANVTQKETAGWMGFHAMLG